MAEELGHILRIIRRYVIELQKQRIIVSKAYLYGSFAKGHPNEFSDIDLALISEDFTGDWFEDRRRIVPLRREIDERLEPMPFLHKDFHQGNPLAADIMEHGIEIELDAVKISDSG
ncbi:MAG: nucleotidyltransferase domain-containing protein [bacterium]